MGWSVLTEHLYGEAYFGPVSEKPATVLDRYARILRDHVGPGRVLDVGCARGASLPILQGYGFQAIGLDISRAALGHAKTQSAVCGALPRTPFADSSFDGVLLLDVIEHIRNPLDALCELYRLLRPGGVAIVTTPNVNSIMRPLMGKKWHGLQDPTHVLFYSYFSLAHLLRAAGLQPVAWRTVSHSLPLLGSILEKFKTAGELCIIARCLSEETA